MTTHNPTKAPDVLIATMPQALSNGVIPIQTIRASDPHPLDAGMDLPLAEDANLEPGEQGTLGTGHCFGIPQGWVGLIRLRSSTHQLLLLAGVVDPDYTGEVFLKVQNLSPERMALTKNQRIAQILIVPVNTNLVFTPAGIIEAAGTFRHNDTLASTGQ